MNVPGTNTCRWLDAESPLHIASEKKMRQEAAHLLGPGDNHRTEWTPFSFPMKDSSGEEIKNAPMSYILDLWEKIEEMLNANDDEDKG